MLKLFVLLVSIPIFGCTVRAALHSATPATCQELDWPNNYASHGAYVCDDRGVRCYMDGRGISCVELRAPK